MNDEPGSLNPQNFCSRFCPQGPQMKAQCIDLGLLYVQNVVSLVIFLDQAIEVGAPLLVVVVVVLGVVLVVVAIVVVAVVVVVVVVGIVGFRGNHPEMSKMDIVNILNLTVRIQLPDDGFKVLLS